MYMVNDHHQMMWPQRKQIKTYIAIKFQALYKSLNYNEAQQRLLMMDMREQASLFEYIM